MIVQYFCIAKRRFHIRNVVFTRAKVISNIAELCHFVSQNTIESSSSFEVASIVVLPNFLAYLSA